MSPSFRATGPADAPRVRAFLGEIFRSEAGAPLLDEAQIDWKYYRPHPHWDGSRSFVYEVGSEVAAHVCSWPIRLHSAEGIVEAANPIDWAASTRIPGIGALILRQIRGVREVSLCIGGTPVARKVIAQSGYRPLAELEFHARPLRPLRQALTHPRRDWKLPARTARNLVWAARSAPAVPEGWTCEAIEPSRLPDAVLPGPLPNVAVAARSRELFAYFLLCPVARHQLFLVADRGAPVGYFLLSFTPGEARVSDASVTDPTVARWRGLYAAAFRAALDEGSGAELSAACSLATARTALTECGFRSSRSLPVMVFDPRKRLASAMGVQLQMIDGDFGFLHENRPEYQT